MTMNMILFGQNQACLTIIEFIAKTN